MRVATAWILTLMLTPAFCVAQSDPASLDNLADIQNLSPVAWWPLAPGWYLVMLAAAAMLLMLFLKARRRRKLNAYRITALKELKQFSGSQQELPQIASLLKRIAMARMPRQMVAELSVAEWMEWLDRVGNGVTFSEHSKQLLGEALYSDRQVNEEEMKELLTTTRKWIRRHVIDTTRSTADLSGAEG